MHTGSIKNKGRQIMENTKSNTKLDLIFAEDPGKLLLNVRNYLENEKLKPVSLNIVKECNNFCALIVGEPKDEFIG